VAAFAIAAELAAMHVILAMACGAGSIRDLVRRELHVVAGLAGRTRVRAVQGEIRVPVVVEGPGTPSGGVVATLTRAPQTALVSVVVRVAGVARGRRVLECLRFVAVVAGCFGMRAEQREVREIVIESDALLPRALVVALRALPAFVAAMHVV